MSLPAMVVLRCSAANASYSWLRGVPAVRRSTSDPVEHSGPLAGGHACEVAEGHMVCGQLQLHGRKVQANVLETVEHDAVRRFLEPGLRGSRGVTWCTPTFDDAGDLRWRAGA